MTGPSSATIGSATRWGPLWGARPTDWALSEDRQPPTYEAALERTGLELGRRVLDIGCGHERCDLGATKQIVRPFLAPRPPDALPDLDFSQPEALEMLAAEVGLRPDREFNEPRSPSPGSPSSSARKRERELVDCHRRRARALPNPRGQLSALERFHFLIART